MITKDLRIPFHLCDPAKIMFFGAFFEIYHMFLEQNLPEMGILWDDWFQAPYGAPVRGLKTQYNAPLQYGVIYQARIGVLNLGTSSVTFRFEVCSKEKGLHAFTEVTHAFVNGATRTKQDLPKPIRQSLSKHVIA